MDEEQPLVQNEIERDIENDNDENEMNIVEQGEVWNESNASEIRNIDDNISREAVDNESNFDDRPLPILIEGDPNFPDIAPSNENESSEDGEGENIENQIEVEIEDNGHNNRQRIVILYENRVEVVGGESNSDENESDVEDLDDESAIAVSSSFNDDSENDDADADERETFDTELPAQHQYMGESREVGGRIILEENDYVEIPVISQPGIILMPGQTLPMTFFQPAVISMMKRLVETTKTFGILHKR